MRSGGRHSKTDSGLSSCVGRPWTRSVDWVLPGNAQSELAHGVQADRSATGHDRTGLGPLGGLVGSAAGRAWRHATDGGWFAYDMKVSQATPLELICTYWGSDSGGREFDIIVDGSKIAAQKLENQRPGEFFEQNYQIPANVTAGRSCDCSVSKRTRVRQPADCSSAASKEVAAQLIKG